MNIKTLILNFADDVSGLGSQIGVSVEHDNHQRFALDCQENFSCCLSSLSEDWNSHSIVSEDIMISNEDL